MFGNEHICALFRPSSRSFLMPLQPGDGRCKKYLRNLKKLIFISDHNPSTHRIFQSDVEIETERKRHVESGSWIIHPFSVFRLYYEMWMAFIFFCCFIYMPLEAAYSWTTIKLDAVENLLIGFCWIDIVINFRTGYVASDRHVELRPGKIAKNYILSFYLISDILSSLPENYWGVGRDVLTRISNYLAILKAVRVYTFFQYSTRSLNFWKLKSFYYKLICLLLLIIHYVACFRALLPNIQMDLQGRMQEYKRDRKNTYPQGAFQAYCYDLYQSSASLLNAEKTIYLKNKPWVVILYTMFMYFVGKIIFAFVAVIVAQHMTQFSTLETKYQAMISQVNAFMKAHHFPETLQKRMNQYYWYKYGGKYLNESRIDNYISDKLRKEIKYNTCRQIMESHSFFTKVPQNILEQIVSHLKEEIYLPTDVIIRAGTPGDCMYFLASGTVSVTTPSGKEVCHLQDGDYFGEVGLIMPNRKAIANVTALETCEVYKLERKGFRKYFETDADLYKSMQKEAKKRYTSTIAIEEHYVKTLNVS